ncbi:MAG: hypothetical protein JWQ71_874 [Pedosphaera sp.]|nr:hypothetical protein [Pedosphaera sp.]
MADTFQVIHSNRFPIERVRWVFDNYFMYGSTREDGICFAVLTRRDNSNLNPADLDVIFQEFQGLTP